jgi:hypothetical protein
VAKGREGSKPTGHARKKAEVSSPTEFDELLRFIVTPQGRFALAFIRGGDRPQRQGVLASLATLLKEKAIELRQIDLSHREVTDLLSSQVMRGLELPGMKVLPQFQ